MRLQHSDGLPVAPDQLKYLWLKRSSLYPSCLGESEAIQRPVTILQTPVPCVKFIPLRVIGYPPPFSTIDSRHPRATAAHRSSPHTLAPKRSVHINRLIGPRITKDASSFHVPFPTVRVSRS